MLNTHTLTHIPASWRGYIALLIFHEVPGLLQLPGSLAIIIGFTLVNLGQARPE